MPENTDQLSLESLIENNKEYERLIQDYRKRLETAKLFFDEETFLTQELQRIPTYLEPMKIEVIEGTMKGEMNYSKYSKMGYDWLKMGRNFSIEQIISSAKTSYPKNMHFQEAEFSKAIIDNLRRGVAILLYETQLQKELKKFSTVGQFNKSSSAKLNPSKESITDHMEEKIFVSYSWDSLEHEEKVLAFTDFLRKSGFHAEMDKMLSQNETAIDFIKMMHSVMINYQKVIIVLSNGYKEKAEKFKGGVGEEYNLIIKDIKNNPRKYVLVSFEGLSDEIIPLGLKGREVVDMQKQSAKENLFSKLLEHKTYEFSEVGKTKPILPKKEIGHFPLKEDYQTSMLKLAEIEEKKLRLSVQPKLWTNGGGYNGSTGEFHLDLNNKGEDAIIEEIVNNSKDVMIYNVNTPFELEKGSNIKIRGIQNGERHVQYCAIDVDIVYSDSLKNKYRSKITGTGIQIKIADTIEL
jgi:hypothetical protein